MLFCAILGSSATLNFIIIRVFTQCNEAESWVKRYIISLESNNPVFVRVKRTGIQQGQFEPRTARYATLQRFGDPEREYVET